ncbi:AAA family ATPase [Desulfococcaceae bacterium HSG8]|nr:AAA family ATPase [Desulfococcaceae bacterium HSG8]
MRNGSVTKGSALCWDEPEAGLNPGMIPTVVEILLQLERMGVQMFLTTHSYTVLKEFELQRKDHSLRFSALFKKDDGGVQLRQSDSYTTLFPNKIAEEFARIYDLEIKRAIGGK